MELEVRAEVFEVVVVRKLVGDLTVQSNSGLVRPTSSHISRGGRKIDSFKSIVTQTVSLVLPKYNTLLISQ